MPDSRPAASPRVLVCDLDGTLLDENGRAVLEVAAALSELQSAGVAFAVSTGRPYPAARRLLCAAGLSPSLLAAFHGGLIVDLRRRTCLRHLQLSPTDTARLATAMLTEGLEVSLYVGVWRRPASLDGLTSGAGATRLIASGPAPAVDAALARLRRMRTASARVERPQTTRLDVRHAAACKADALRFMADVLGVPLAQVAAAGNDVTDAGMLEAAGLGIAVGSDDALRSLADVAIRADELAAFLRSLGPPAARSAPRDH